MSESLSEVNEPDVFLIFFKPVLLLTSMSIVCPMERCNGMQQLFCYLYNGFWFQSVVIDAIISYDCVNCRTKQFKNETFVIPIGSLESERVE